MKIQVYPRNVEIEVDVADIYAVEASMSALTLIVHVPGLQIPAINGFALTETYVFKLDFIEMSDARWIRPAKISSMQRWGDEYVRVMLDGVRQSFDLFPGERDLRAVYKDFRAKLPLGAPSFDELDVAA
jgi:hypothetical protein